MAGSGGVFHADLHVHSRFSRACSKDCDVPHLAWWAARKGVKVVGTGDFTHPAWAARLKECLTPAEPGLLRLCPEEEQRLRRALPPSCGPEVRFLLSAEISTIYRRDDATRKIHHLVYAPTFEAAGNITAALAKIGNLASDGRPILGLDSRHLLEITLNAGPGCFLVPAHIWTPWFAVLGSKSGFDTVTDCYGDLADHVFAVETGLSSDPPMNWMCTTLDRYRLVSNSDAHSPPMLGREATTFGTEVDYFAMVEALRTGQGLAGTINFFPEEGRYHLDGHRKCGIRFEPAESKTHAGICPECGKPLTIGVLHRVAELADRPAGRRPQGAADYTNLVSLPEIVGEIRRSGPKSKKVTAQVDRLVAALGPELRILCDVDLTDIGRVAGSLLGEAVARLRRGAVIKQAGYDGEYGVIRLFHPDELGQSGALFDVPARQREASPDWVPADANATRHRGGTASPAAPLPGALSPGALSPGALSPGALPTGALPPGALRRDRPGVPGTGADDLDPDQRAAAGAPGPLMIIAGPGTGKTRTLAYRIAAQVAASGLPPQACLALTFTRRAAGELRERLTALIPGRAGLPMVTTFHGLGLAILREHAGRLGLATDFGVADERVRLAVAAELTGSPAGARRLLASAQAGAAERAELTRALTARDLVDFDGLVDLPAALLREEPAITAALRDRWRFISVDEYQDIDASQYELLRLLGADGTGLTVIGDPDQAIYGFRGADVGFFLRFARDYPAASSVQLTRNYRSSPAIVTGALQAIAPATLVPGRVLYPVATYPAAVSGRAAAAEAAADSGQAAGGDGSGAAGSTSRAAGAAQADGSRTPDRSGQATGGTRAASSKAAAGSGTGGRSGAVAGVTPSAGDGGEPGGIPPARITVYEAADEQAEAAWIAESIDRLLGGSSFHSLDSGRADGHAGGRLGLADIAVLYRTDAQAGPLGQALTRAGLPFQKRSHDLLARRTGAAEIIQEMRLAGPGADTGATAVAEGLAGAVRKLAARFPGDGGSAVDVRAAGEVLAPLARRCGTDLERFLTEIALGAEADSLDPRADAITLLTLHAAKGLEFGAVFIAGCERGLLPLWVPGARDEARSDVAEERRLLFVGMTRAQRHLFLTCAARRHRHSVTVEAGPSPFLAAIDRSLLDRPGPGRPRRPGGRQLRLL